MLALRCQQLFEIVRRAFLIAGSEKKIARDPRIGGIGMDGGEIGGDELTQILACGANRQR